VKFNDLIYFCESKVIPADYHGFYSSLPHHNPLQPSQAREQNCDILELLATRTAIKMT
jgi:hypothetical protein